MTSDLLASLAGIVLSLLFSYAPGVKDWFEGLSGDYKRLVMLGALLVVSAGIIGLACIGRYDAISCDADGVYEIIGIFIVAAIANQGAYMLTPKRGK